MWHTIYSLPYHLSAGKTLRQDKTLQLQSHPLILWTRTALKSQTRRKTRVKIKMHQQSHDTLKESVWICCFRLRNLACVFFGFFSVATFYSKAHIYCSPAHVYMRILNLVMLNLQMVCFDILWNRNGCNVKLMYDFIIHFHPSVQGKVCASWENTACTVLVLAACVYNKAYLILHVTNKLLQICYIRQADQTSLNDYYFGTDIKGQLKTGK